MTHRYHSCGLAVCLLSTKPPQGHAYAVCNVKLVDRFQLVQLRKYVAQYGTGRVWVPIRQA